MNELEKLREIKETLNMLVNLVEDLKRRNFKLERERNALRRNYELMAGIPWRYEQRKDEQN